DAPEGFRAVSDPGIEPWAARVGRLDQRVVAAVVSALSSLLQRLPDRILHRLAAAAGIVLYLAWPGRRALVRANLRQICTWLAASPRATPPVRAAATNTLALERLVVTAFGHYLRYYLEVALVPAYTPAYLAERLRIESPDLIPEALPGRPADGVGRIFIGLHLGALELPGLLAVRRAGVPITAPMEAIRNAPLQSYLVRRRGSIGVTIIPIRGARGRLLRALGRGEIAGLVADRDLSGNGVAVTLFGAPTRLPAGPALLAIESGARAYVAAARRTGPGEYALRALTLATPGTGTRRERMSTFVEAQARAFESLIADAPEQWWTIFFPIWPHLGRHPGSKARRRAARPR
ncbi:MAG: hypothetical protein M3295_07215, partial [Chloroflexota bacterium]|nr:hypothetical protein [Chloroflexota bacterium]